MNNETTYPFNKAWKAAEHIFNLLLPHCTRIHIAGSLRRLKPLVKDIEIVCEPKKEIKNSGLFSDITEIITCSHFTGMLSTITESVIIGNVNGRYMRIRTNSKLCPGICLDLFMPNPYDYYRMYAIRTGSAEYAHHVIAAAWKKKGWVGIKNMGLRKMLECSTTGGKDKIWHCDNPKATLPPEWKSEGEFFAWLGLEYIDPEYRQFKTLNEAQ